MLGIHLDENIAGSGGGIKKALSEKLRARIDLSVCQRLYGLSSDGTR